MAFRDLDAAVLAAVLQLSPNAYGVTIRARVGELLGGRVPSAGSVHQALERMERQGRLRAERGDPLPVRGGRARRLFFLTAQGEHILREASLEAERRARVLRPNWGRA